MIGLLKKWQTFFYEKYFLLSLSLTCWLCHSNFFFLFKKFSFGKIIIILKLNVKFKRQQETETLNENAASEESIDTKNETILAEEKKLMDTLTDVNLISDTPPNKIK